VLMTIPFRFTAGRSCGVLSLATMLVDWFRPDHRLAEKLDPQPVGFAREVPFALLLPAGQFEAAAVPAKRSAIQRSTV
jgi:hypothetical protein